MTTTGGSSGQVLAPCSSMSTLWLSWGLPPGGTSGFHSGAGLGAPGAGLEHCIPCAHCRVQALGGGVDGATHCLTRARLVLSLIPFIQLKCFKPPISSSLSHHLSLERKCQQCLKNQLLRTLVYSR